MGTAIIAGGNAPPVLEAAEHAFNAVTFFVESNILSRLAAVRWAFRCVVSIITVVGASLSSAKAAKRRLKTPALLQRTKRL